MKPAPGSVLITGPEGFIGAALVNSLTADGIDVIGTKERGGTVDVTDVHGIHRVFERFQPSAVVHLGGISGPMLARDNPITIADVNIGGTANLLEAARIHGLERFVFASSNTVYGSNSAALTENDTVPRPSSVYGASKVAGEALCSTYSKRYGVPTTSLRISAVYGPGRTTHCFIGQVLRDALEGKTTRLAYGRDFHRQYVFIDDAVASIRLALANESRTNGGTYNVSGSEWKTMGEIAEQVSELVPSARIELEDGPDPDDDDVQGPYDLTLARTALGYKPAVNLREGMLRYLDHMRRTHVS